MRPILSLLCVLVLAASGCASHSKTEAPATTVPTILTAPAITHLPGQNDSAQVALGVAAAAFPTAHDSGEPTLGVTPEGRLFVTSATFHNFGGPRTDILRSDDGGKTWADVSPLLASTRSHPVTGDPMLYYDTDTQRLFDIDQVDIACDYISSSDDDGYSWTPTTPACLYPPSDHQTIVAATPALLPAGPLYSKTVYVCMNQIAQTNCERSLDGGLTFQQATPPFQGIDTGEGSGDPTNAVCSGLVGHLKAAPDGTLYLPRDQCGRPLIAVSSDSATTWTVKQVSDVRVEGSDPAVAVAADGTVYYTWNVASGLMMTSSKDKGITWSEPIQVMAPGLTAANIPAIVAGGEDRVAIVYYGTGSAGGYPAIQKTQSVADNATWTAYLAIVENASSPAPKLLTVRLADDGDVLARGNCGPGRCKGTFDFIDIQVDHEGRPWIAFTDSCRDKCEQAGATEKDNGGGRGLVGTLATGRSLLDGKELPPVHGAE
jgi:hypothetical protein